MAEIIKVKKLSDKATLPTKAHLSDSGWDLYSSENRVLLPGQTSVIKTDIAFGIPSGHEIHIRPRSGVSTKTPLRVIFGTIDKNYTGECGVMVHNTGDTEFAIPAKYKLAQAVLQVLPMSIMEEVDSLEETDRGSKGYGSSGV